MHRVLFLVLLTMAAASAAAAQSCATLSGQFDCRAAASRPPANSPVAPRAGQDAEVHGYGETTVSNGGVSTTLNHKVIDSHGIVEFGFSGSTGTTCRLPGYSTGCK